ncbi:hypothetical protein NM208_g2414 [Fusarium decemcellulare]|uniref:Uncharacterized protein n=1 Tax=Fusarium decemcellulare TaxID=57161 RepID=A0ACC1SSH8_9HYPO|nr:hypothetical protein NM208_g2414 [Fusarium decemcellulare]
MHACYTPHIASLGLSMSAGLQPRSDNSVVRLRQDKWRRNEQSSVPTTVALALVLPPALPPRRPGKWDDPISCHLDVVSLEEKPEFEALSYTWGERQRNNAKSRMRLNGQDFPIAFNLETALRHLRSEADARALWVDAICINQADIEERNEQISIMRDVYSYSKRVLIWLGTVDEPRRPKDPNVKKQKQLCHWRTDFTTWSESSVPHPEDMAIIDDFHDRIDQYYRLPLSLRHNLTIDHVKGAFCFASLLAQNKHVNGHDILILNNHDAFHRIIMALFGIMDRPWWIRQWVIQEIVLAPSAILHHGHFVAPWELFSHAARNYEHHRKDCCQNHYKYLHGNDIRHVEHFYRTIIELDDLRHKWQSILKNQAPIKINLRELLWQFRSRDTTDPKDKVFVLFPLVNDWGNQDQMEADYNMEIRRIYRAVVEKVMAIDESLLILMGNTEKSKDLIDLPSWVPDWTIKPPQFESERLERTKLFNASKGIKPKPKFHGQKVLELGGVRFDSITTTSEIMVYGDDDETLEVFRSWYNLLCDNQPIMSRYPTKEPRMAAYWRTLCMDTVRSLGFRGVPLNKDRRYRRCSRCYVREATKQWMSRTGLPHSTVADSSSALQIPLVSRPGSREPSPHRLPVQETGPDGEEKLTYVAVDFAVTSATLNRRLFFTKKGYMGLGPATMKAGDAAYVFAGGHMPFIVRHAKERDVPKVGMRNCHELIGDCYIHGIMDGEVMDKFEQDKRSVYLLVPAIAMSTNSDAVFEPLHDETLSIPLQESGGLLLGQRSSTRNDAAESPEPTLSAAQQPPFLSNSIYDLLSLALATLALVGLSILLVVCQNKPNPEWTTGVTLNAIVSIVSTVFRGGILLPVTHCISQFGWLWYTQRRSLQDICYFDAASRGPLGSAQLLFKLQPLQYASIGAIVTIAATAIGPFFQQIVRYETRAVADPNQQARTVAAYQWGQSPPPDFITPSYPDIPHEIQVAVRIGLLSSHLSSTPNPLYSCPSGNCTWEPFSTPAVSSQCEDITSHVRLNCSRSMATEFQEEEDICNIVADEDELLQPLLQYSSRNMTGFLAMVQWVKAYSLKPLDYIQPNTTFEAGRCAFYFSIRHINATVSEGVYSEKLLGEHTSAKILNQSYSNDVTNMGFYEAWDENSLGLEYQPAFPSGRKDRGPSILQGNVSSGASGMLVGLEYATMLYQASNTTRAMHYMAEYLTLEMRANASTALQTSRQDPSLIDEKSVVYGQVLVQQQYVIVRWNWLILPVSIHILTVLFLTLASVETRRGKVGIWHTSPLTLFFHAQLSNDARSLLDSTTSPLDTAEAMHDAAADLRIRIGADRPISHNAILE